MNRKNSWCMCTPVSSSGFFFDMPEDDPSRKTEAEEPISVGFGRRWEEEGQRWEAGITQFTSVRHDDDDDERLSSA